MVGTSRAPLSGFIIESRVSSQGSPAPLAIPQLHWAVLQSTYCTARPHCTYTLAVQQSSSPAVQKGTGLGPARCLPILGASGRPNSRDIVRSSNGWPIPLRPISLSEYWDYSEDKTASIQLRVYSHKVKARVLSCCLRFESYLPYTAATRLLLELEAGKRGRAPKGGGHALAKVGAP